MNPMQLLQLMRGGANPAQMLMSFAQQNPQLQQAMQLLNGKTPQQMRETVMGVAQQRGVDVGQIAQQLGMRLPD